MNFMRILVILSLSSVILLANPMNIIIPKPKIIESKNGQPFHLTKARLIYADQVFLNEAQIFLEELKEELDVDCQVTADPQSGLSSAQIILLDLNDVPTPFSQYQTIFERLGNEIKEEGYILYPAGEKIILAAFTTTGMFNGLQSLLQLAVYEHVTGDAFQPNLIIDWPDLSLRGISDDMSRGQVSTLDNLKKIIRFLARYKMNVYMPYIEDIFPVSTYPQIGNQRGAITTAEWAEMQDYAQRYHVQIIPIFQTLGHYENILLDPAFHPIAEFPGSASLEVLHPETYKFLEKAFTEVVPAFSSPFFHIGADESWDVGKYKTIELVDRFGIASVHARHYQKVYDLLQPYNKKIMMYGDIILNHPTILNEIPKDIIVIDWQYHVTDYYNSTEVFKKAGQPFIVSPGTHNWGNWFPDLTDAALNISIITEDGKSNGALGSICSNWGDYGGMNLREFNYLPFAYSAAVSWNLADSDPAAFENRFFIQFYQSPNVQISAVYHNLAAMASEISWLEFIGHPFYNLPEEKAPILRRRYLLSSVAEETRLLLKATTLNSNTEHFGLLNLTNDLFAWYAELDKNRLEHHKLLSLYPAQFELRKHEIAARYLYLAGQLETLTERYQKAWLLTNRPDNLPRMVNLFERVSIQLKAKAAGFAQSDYGFNGATDVSFIATADEDAKGAKSFLARKVFYLEQLPLEAMLEFIANSDATVWINGQEIGRVFARKSLSALVEAERVKTVEVKKYLKKGRNLIAVSVRNYTESAAAFYSWLEIETKTGRQRIATDKSWLINESQIDGWNSLQFDDNAWYNATEIKKTWLIQRPDFKNNLPGRIEYYRY